ncbi:MAG: chemotaxis protein CheW [ANME-2 cluster archaeon]|jgi:purine-binding chemotaxis protein CheW|nr:chemotaxis protein CheW [ANME-2 cluster archaeon]
MIENTSDEKHTASIDWSIIHRNLADARAAVEQEWMPSASEKKRILKERAIALAQEPEDKDTAEEYLEIVEFLLAYEKYGIESGYIREVYPMKELTPLPCTPPFVLGIINVRGQIISVIDIKKFFDLPEKGLTDLNKVIIVNDGKMEFGILADVIPGVCSVALSELQPSLPTLTGIRAEYLRGVTKERLVVLDMEMILSDEKIIVHKEV